MTQADEYIAKKANELCRDLIQHGVTPAIALRAAGRFAAQMYELAVEGAQRRDRALELAIKATGYRPSANPGDLANFVERVADSFMGYLAAPKAPDVSEP